MAEFFKRKHRNGVLGKLWWTRLGGVRVSTGCRDLRAAQAWRRKQEREGADPRHAAAEGARLDDAIREVYAELRRRGRADPTIERAKQKLGHFADVWGADCRLAEIDAALVSSYIDKRLKDPGARAESTLSRTTIRDELAFLRQMLKLARRNGLYALDVEDVLPIMFESHHQPVTRWITSENLPKLLAKVTTEHAAHICWMVAVGGRLADSYRARREDIGKADVLVRVSKTARRTGKSTRTVPISPFMRTLLDFAVKHADGVDLMFRDWPKIQRDMKAACERAGIPPVTPNDLRRSFGKWHRARGFEPSLISVLLGHTTSKLAETTYATIEGEELGKLVKITARKGATARYKNGTHDPKKTKSAGGMR